MARRHEVRLPVPRKLPSRVYKQYKFVRRETLSDAYGHHGHNFPLVLPFKVVLNASKSTATFGIPSTNNNGFSIKYLSQLPNSTFTSGTVDFASRLTQNVGLNIILDTNVTPPAEFEHNDTRLKLHFSVTIT